MATRRWLGLGAPFLLTPIGVLVAGLREARQGMSLSLFEPLPQERLPALSIVVAAKDEAQRIELALGSLLNLDYPEFEVIFVDDRSQDGTREIAQRLLREHPRRERLTVIANHELPEGWLGKVHALHLGVKTARHPLVLLTDADVTYSPLALQRAVTAQQVLGADHLTLAPRFEVSGFWEPVLVAYFFVLFMARFQPSTVHRKKERFVGVGAFNLLTRGCLERLEYLEPLKLQVVDDIHLGRMVKARCGRQFALLGQNELSVHWFSGFRGVIRGLEKNAYAGLNYHLPTAIGAAIFSAAPFWTTLLLFWKAGWGWALAWYLFGVALGTLAAIGTGVGAWTGAAFPIAGLVLAYTMLRSAILAEVRQAIVWRGTRYSLRALRQAHQDFIAREAL